MVLESNEVRDAIDFELNRIDQKLAKETGEDAKTLSRSRHSIAELELKMTLIEEVVIDYRNHKKCS